MCFAAWLIAFSILLFITNKRLPDHDPYLLPIMSLLSGWGLLIIWRLDHNFGFRQAIWLLVCAAALWALLYVKDLLGLLYRYKYIWLVCGLILTGLTFIFGVYPGGEGPRLWLQIGGVFLQPSEPLKLLLVIFLSAYLADRFPVTFNFARLILPSFVLFLFALGILLAQHDLGTAAIFIILYIGIIFLASDRRRMIIVGGIFLVAAGLLGYRLYSVIQIRVNAWLNPWLDPSGKSYQIIQSLLAFAAGGIFGRGPGLGSPGLVPIAHSDFITAAIGEEFGMVGTIGLFCLLCILILRGFKIALQSRNQYQRYLAAGITIYLVSQSILIMAGNLRLLPLTGVTLPFISYGGSSLITTFVAGLLLLLISNDQDEELAPLRKSLGFQMIQGALLLGFVGLSLSNGWWSLIRADDLQTRADNPRLSIAEKYSKRGSLLDRNNQVIVQTEGQPGDYWRHFLYPPLSPVTGYNDPVYGQSGLEASLDGYLRGTQGNASSVIWWHQFLYSEPPSGLDVRLSIDLNIQQKADELLGNHTGALVVMKANTGEVLALASHPNIDPNQVSTQWSNWMSDPTSPLLDRAVQSEYTLGTALGVFLSTDIKQDLAPLTFTTTGVDLSSRWLECAVPITSKLLLSNLLSSGCPAATLNLAQTMGNDAILSVIKKLGFRNSPDLRLEVAAPPANLDFSDLGQFLFGRNQLRVTPLQAARAAAAISNGGSLPTPRLVASIRNPIQGWIVLPVEPAAPVVLSNIDSLNQQLRVPGKYYWTAVAASQSQQGVLSWFIGGTTTDWNGTPISVAIVLEENNPNSINSIGQSILDFSSNP